MSDDIVKQLNHWADWNDGKTTVSPIEDPLVDSLSRTMREAADEIERLRALITEWVDATTDGGVMYQGITQRWWDAKEALRKAVGR